jgi:hypothetical protein
MKLAITSLLVVASMSMSAALHASFRLGAAGDPRPWSPRATNQLLITTMSVSFYRHGATPRLLSNGIRKFQRGVSRKQ